jgi:prealbumin domain-containing protein
MRTIFTSTILASVLTVGLPGGAAAQNPYSIEHPAIVPDAGSTEVTDPSGSSKELGPINASSTKLGVIHTAAVPMLGQTNPNAQVDLNAIWTQTQTVGGHVWYYFGWSRDSANGSGFISIEIQKAKSTCDYTSDQTIGLCNPWAGRSAGDFILLWDQQGSSRDIYIRTFQQSGNQLVLGTAVKLDASKAVAEYSATGFQGEAAVDLTAAGVFPDAACVSFANTIPGTVTGNSDTADYKDAVIAQFPSVSNCGTLKVKKSTDPIDQTGPPPDYFPYTVARTNNDDLKYDGTKSINGTLQADGSNAEYVGLIDGTNFTLAEGSVASPWQLVSITCVLHAPSGDVSAGPSTGFQVKASQVTECTILNRLNQGSLKIIKHVINDNGGTAVASDFTMFVGNAGNLSFNGSESGVTTTLPAGTTFNVSEGMNQWAGLYSSTIGDATLGPDCSGSIVTGLTKTCYITNDDKAPSLTLNKVVVNDNGGTKLESAWTLTANGGAAGSLSGPGAAGNADVVSGPTFKAGTYALSEALSPPDANNGGYQASAWVCTGTGTQSGSSITLGLNQSAVCTITNDDKPAQPTIGTAQHVILHDQANIAGVRRGGTEPILVNFYLYATLAACNADTNKNGTGSIGSNTNRPIIFADGTVTSGVATTDTGVSVSPAVATTYFWRVTSANPANNRNAQFSSDCTESAAITLSGS